MFLSRCCDYVWSLLREFTVGWWEVVWTRCRESLSNTLLSAACTCSDLNMDLIHSKSNKIGSSVLPTSHICGAPITLSGSGPPHGTCDTFSTQGSVDATVLRELKLQGAVIPQIIVWHRCVVSAVCLSLHICKEQVSTFRRRGKYHF